MKSGEVVFKHDGAHGPGQTGEHLRLVAFYINLHERRLPEFVDQRVQCRHWDGNRPAPRVIRRRYTTPLVRQGRQSLPFSDVQCRFSDLIANSSFDDLERVVAAHDADEIRIRLDSEHLTTNLLERLGDVTPGCAHIEGELAGTRQLREERAGLLSLSPRLTIECGLVRVAYELVSGLQLTRQTKATSLG